MKLILTVGLPRSGKSTWAKGTGFPIVNPDSIRLAVHGQAYREESEPLVWAMAYMMVRALFLAGNETVVVDATNVTKKRRDEWKSRFREASIEFVVFPTTEEECIRRAIETGREDVIPVIRRQRQDWDFDEPGIRIEDANGRRETP